VPREDAYDRLPYTDHAYAESHPDRLRAVARLSGWEAPDVTWARILELGCGRGGNLLPMAAGLAGHPGATFVGVDRSPVQIAEARRIAREAALGNVQLAEGDLEALDLPAGAFDYVVAHGVCSWVPEPARRALLRATARALAPGGVAYLSFNVLPGWYERLAARDWLRFEGAARARGADGADTDAAASLRWLRDQVSVELSSYRAQLAQVARRLGETDPAYAAHEYRATEHHPQTVCDLLGEAAEAGLDYLGDAIPGETALELLPEAVQDRAQGLDPARAQQLVDFVRNTAFRRALFVGRDDARARGWRWPSRLDAGALESLRISSRLRAVSGSAAPAEGGRETFEAEGLRVQVVHAATCRALHELAARAPRSIAFGDLARGEAPDSRAALREEVFDLWLATGAVDLHTFEPALGDASAPRPRACPVARWHALHGGTITNLRHHEVRLPERVLVSLLGCLDGASDVAQLGHRLREALAPAAVTDAELEALVRAGLDRLASAALLVP
jgi:SAM-dependent methyltransferase